MSKSRATHSAPTAKPREPQFRAHGLLLAALAALCVARPLLPSEGVSWLGDGHPFNMLWLSLAVVTCLAAVGQGGLPARISRTDLAVLALFICYAISALHAVVNASPRPAMNMLWEWTSLGLVYFLVRQLVRTAAQTRALMAVAIALAVVLAADGYYQYFVSMPADRSQYAADPDAMLRDSGQWYAPDSAERRAFENRLRSTEPMATFALTNSLAGYLAPWLLVTLGIGAGGWAARHSTASRTRLTLAAAALAIGGCLILTKSRSAYVATALGLALLPLCLPGVRQRLTWRIGLALAGAVVVLVAGAVAVRGLDRQVLSESGKSLGYRLEYWQATWAMIREHPWLGCGPGNFQDAYMRYKLPQASEEIQDPHNLFFEVWGSAGTPAFLALLAVLGCFAWQTWRRDRPEPAQSAGDHAPPRDARALPVGAAVGILLAYFVGPLVTLQLGPLEVWGGLILGGLTIAGLWPWVRDGRLLATLVPLAVAVLVVHLSASGGMSIPGVAYSFWILLALGVNQTSGAQVPNEAPRSTTVPWGTIAVMALSGAGATACYLTAYQPVLRATAAMYRAQTDEQRNDWTHYERALLEAAEADPLYAQGWPMLAGLDFQRISARGAAGGAREQFDRAVRMMLRLRPQSSGAYRQAGGWLLKLYQRGGDPADIRQAIEYYERATEFYPNSALTHAEWAFALAAAQQHDQARQEARRARQLDAAMPHTDKKLPAEIDERLRGIEDQAAAGSPTEAILAPPEKNE